jgi:hypothetical protein
VGVGPFHPGNRAFQVNRPIDVKLRGKGVMRPSRRNRQQQACGNRKHQPGADYIPHYFKGMPFICRCL